MRSRKRIGRGTGAGMLAVVGLVVVLLTGCSSPPPPRAVSQFPNIRRTVVFPFENLTQENNDAGRKITGMFASVLHTRTGLEIISQGDVESFAIAERIRSADQLDTEMLRQMYRQLNVQMVVIGAVNEYTYVRGGESTPVVGLTVRIVDPKTGRMIWSTTVTREGSDAQGIFGIGRVKSLGQMSTSVVEEVVSTISMEADEIAKIMRRGDLARAEESRPDPIPDRKPTTNEPDPPAEEDLDRADVRRAVKRYWERIKREYE